MPSTSVFFSQLHEKVVHPSVYTLINSKKDSFNLYSPFFPRLHYWPQRTDNGITYIKKGQALKLIKAQLFKIAFTNNFSSGVFFFKKVQREYSITQLSRDILQWNSLPSHAHCCGIITCQWFSACVLSKSFDGVNASSVNHCVKAMHRSFLKGKYKQSIHLLGCQ